MYHWKLIGMSKCYIINDNILFYPDSGTLSSSLTGNSIKLNTPTAQLLEAFITRMGLTISQSELYSIAWGDNGINVTPNTLYQNISLLRKALQDSGIPGESLKTLRGKGFIFTVTSVVDDSIAPQEKIEPVKENDNVKKSDHIIYYVLISVTSLMILLFTLLFYAYKDIPNRVNNYPRNFMFLSTINGCSIFSSTEGKTIKNKLKVNDLIKTLTLECEAYPYVYVNYSERHPTISIISCEFDMDYKKQNNCKTEIFINHGGLDETQH
jgi:DNA-binding winged helix-turn-helix (wHTH) protein